jgi:hypothetical protein
VAAASEHQLQRELKFPGILRAGNDSEIGSTEDAAREIEVGMIE